MVANIVIPARSTEPVTFYAVDTRSDFLNRFFFVFEAVVEFQTVLVRLTDVLSIRKWRDNFHRTSIRYARASKRRRPGWAERKS